MNTAEFRAEVARKGARYNDLADNLGITYATLNNKVNGKTDFKLSEVEKLRDLLGIEPDRLYTIFFAK